MSISGKTYETSNKTFNDSAQLLRLSYRKISDLSRNIDDIQRKMVVNKANKKNLLTYDDSLSQISQLLNEKNLNYSGIIDKLPVEREKENFLYDQIVYNKSNFNRAKIIAQKKGKLMPPTSSSLSCKNIFQSLPTENKSISDISKAGKKRNYRNRKNRISCFCFF